ncbi:efflux transporter outer membrane subunit, partial [Pseudomonas lactis]
MNKQTLCTLGMAWMLGGCSLIPEYQQPAAPTPAQYPQGGVYRLAQAGNMAQNPDWQQLFHDPALQQLINDALVNNRDLRVAALNVQAFQAQYRIQRADLFPAISATGAGKRQKLPGSVTGTGKSAITSNYSATLGLSAYELDLFGRVRSLSEQALLTYLGSEQARRSAQLSLVANVANAYLTWRADQELLALAEQTLAANDHSWQLTRRSKSAGKASALDVVQARTAVESTRASVARYERQVAQDLNNLMLLVGGPVDEHLPARPLADDLVARVPAGLPSDLLQRRPDILQAEYQLQAANANIGAARAAFFPSVTLTANAGSTSTE